MTTHLQALARALDAFVEERDPLIGRVHRRDLTIEQLVEDRDRLVKSVVELETENSEARASHRARFAELEGELDELTDERDNLAEALEVASASGANEAEGS